MKEAVIIGGGPGGAGAALGLKGKADRITVYEANSRLALKPCGRGIPLLGDIPFKPPKEAIHHRIRRAVMYVDGEPLFELTGAFDGYIVDKALFLEAAFSEAGAEVVYNAKYKPSTGMVRVGGSYRSVEAGLFAGGHPYYRGEKILAIQYRIKTNIFDDADHLEIYFDTSILGYYYIFPAAPGSVDVGVGGFGDVDVLRARLEKFIKRDERLRDRERIRFEGAKIAVGGVIHHRVGGLPAIGEAAGYVLPLTGEGIRPSMLSGLTAAGALVDGGRVEEALSSSWIYKAIGIQRRILEAVKKLEPVERRRLLTSMTSRVHAEIALGRFNKAVLMRELAGNPRLLVFMLRHLG